MAAPGESDGPDGGVHLTVTRPELLDGGSDQIFRQFVHDALAFSARLLAVRDGYGKAIGISGPQYTLLISIAHRGRRCAHPRLGIQ